MPEDHANTTVLVTGASGFIGLHCVLQLLQAGYRVRGTVRSQGRADEVRETMEANVDVADRLEIVEADLTRDEGWADAVHGCSYVLHVASPFPSRTPVHEDELIKPAKDGTLRVLEAAADAGVKRVVITSSLAAVSGGHPFDDARIFTEDDWSIIERKLMAKELPGTAKIGFSWVDVRDVASAHIAAMTTPGGGRSTLLLRDRVLVDRRSCRYSRQALRPRRVEDPDAQAAELHGAHRRIVRSHREDGRLGPWKGTPRLERSDSERSELAAALPRRNDRFDGRDHDSTGNRDRGVGAIAVGPSWPPRLPAQIPQGSPCQ
ncbi:MAG: SDR family NAD(P)-dependent oxidoreductase [Polyangiales bacterium]